MTRGHRDDVAQRPASSAVVTALTGPKVLPTKVMKLPAEGCARENSASVLPSSATAIPAGHDGQRGRDARGGGQEGEAEEEAHGRADVGHRGGGDVRHAEDAAAQPLRRAADGTRRRRRADSSGVRHGDSSFCGVAAVMDARVLDGRAGRTGRQRAGNGGVPSPRARPDRSHPGRVRRAGRRGSGCCARTTAGSGAGPSRHSRPSRSAANSRIPAPPSATARSRWNRVSSSARRAGSSVCSISSTSARSPSSRSAGTSPELCATRPHSSRSWKASSEAASSGSWVTATTVSQSAATKVPPARSAPAVEQAVLAHALQRAAHGDLADSQLLGENARVRQPVSRLHGPQAYPQCDPGPDEIGSALDPRRAGRGVSHPGDRRRPGRAWLVVRPELARCIRHDATLTAC